jgi:UDP-N-acetyl-D-mannosaminuronate dehydrogenase
MINFAKNFTSKTFGLVEEGRKINEMMPFHVVDLLKDAFNEANKSLSDSSILILGASYKPDVKDLQISPVEKIVEILKDNNVKISIYDPYYKNSEIFGIASSDNLISSIEKSDAIIIATAHKEFHDLEPSFLKSKMQTSIVIDSKCIINQYDAKKAGLIYRGIGRGKI